ncbi:MULTISPECIES: TauD/TfdA family dioxygenase [unclassified Streptomyces]|uniref:TauD/TfdA family dioxygenase n=1 Tax=unclassified Streptomyces TaxID=2593676 RepID=UPI000DDB7F82|nr:MULTISPECIES: TauD/TfdA family dioxygenase [unclassified Streptomyces]QZZ31107.1 TauD/TfdA family dioxygenase [Streptomyces sp. ST1015]
MPTELAPHRIPVRRIPQNLSLERSADWLSEHLDDLLDLRTEHGSVLLRGLPFTTAAEFALLRDRIIGKPADYVEKATPRSAYGRGVFTATDVPARRRIRLHNENSYALSYPGLLVFACLTAPAVGGETFLGDVRAMAGMLPEDLVARFREQGWKLVRNYWGHFGLTWQEAFGTEDRAEVERYARTQQLTTEWHGDRLTTTQARSALIRHPRTGDTSWFNHVAFWSEWSLEESVREFLRGECGDDLPFRTFYGDGEPVGRREIELINAAYEQVRMAERWQRGDIMLVDNIRVAHGREPFQGDREVLVAMGDPVERKDCEL